MNHNNFILGDYISTGETLDTEYKEFCFKRNIYMKVNNYDDAFGLQHQEAITKNLEYYFQNIVPKYISCFGNTPELKMKNCNMWLGISDSGEITGIPTLFQFSQRYISSLINDALLPNIRIRQASPQPPGDIYLSDSEKTRVMYDAMRCSVYDCEIDDDFLSDEFAAEKRKHDRLRIANKSKINRYLEAKREWMNTISKFCEKMDIISNKIQFRTQICDYILKYCDTPNKMDFIHRLRDPEKFVTPATPIFKIMKNDPHNIYYWIVKWKDEQIQNLTDYRPVPPVLEKGHCLNTFRSRITCHRKRWTRACSFLKYKIIHIEFVNQIQDEYIYEFFDSKNKSWNIMMRDIGELGPYCKNI
jgi:hypothetical protein